MLKLKVTITGELRVELEHYPGAKTLADVVKMQQKFIDNGDHDPEDVLVGLGDSVVITVKE